MNEVTKRLLAFEDVGRSGSKPQQRWYLKSDQHQPKAANTERSQRVLSIFSQAFGADPFPVAELATVKFVGPTAPEGSKRLDDKKILDWLCIAGWLEYSESDKTLRVTDEGRARLAD